MSEAVDMALNRLDQLFGSACSILVCVIGAITCLQPTWSTFQSGQFRVNIL
jgi:hypothetical protein